MGNEILRVTAPTYVAWCNSIGELRQQQPSDETLRQLNDLLLRRGRRAKAIGMVGVGETFVKALSFQPSSDFDWENGVIEFESLEGYRPSTAAEQIAKLEEVTGIPVVYATAPGREKE